MSRALKVGFAGTPEFARTALLALIESHHTVPLVLTQPDRPSGRGLKLNASAVKEAALKAGIRVLQPHSLKLDGRYPDEAKAAHEALEAAGLDVLVVAAYGLILPQSILDVPRLGCLNIHASLLPRWRGAAPIQRAIEAGDAETGVDIMQMDAGLDTGDVLLEVRCSIEDTDTAGSLTARLATLGAGALIEALDACANGMLAPRPQDDKGALYANKVSKAEAMLNWAESAALLERRIRAFNPAPGASTHRGEQLIKVWRASVRAAQRTAQRPAAPGEIVFVDQAGVGVACGDGVLVLEQLQRAGAKRMSADEFQKSDGFAVGEVLT